MGFLGLTGLSSLVDFGTKLIDKLIPDPQAKAAAQLQLLQLQQSGQLAQLAADTDIAKGQLAVNEKEAASENVFVSGWRPFVGWTCASGLAVQFVIAPFISWGSILTGHNIVFPTLDMGTLLTLLFAMLGLGAYRTVEKVKGTK